MDNSTESTSDARSAEMKSAGPSANQFSLRTMMIATTVLAVLCCIFLTLPAWVGGLTLGVAALLAMPATLALLVYGQGAKRAFALGAATPLTLVFLQLALGRGLPLGGYDPDDPEWKIFFAVAAAVVVFSGFVAQAVRAWCLRTIPRA